MEYNVNVIGSDPEKERTEREGKAMKWKVVVDIAPRIVEGTKGCHKFVFGYYKTKRDATYVANELVKEGQNAFAEKV